MQSVTNFTPARSDDIHKHRKENSFRRQVSVVDLETGREIITARWYGAGSRVYCCVWIHGANVYSSGSGWAGGYGYHKGSAALETALSVAGVAFSEPFGGHGESAETDALAALARHIGADSITIVKAHP